MGNHKATFTYTQYTGTNTVKVAIYKDSDPNAEAGAQYMQGPFTNGVFYFTDLDAVAYKVKRFEVDNADHSHILADYGVFYVFTPSASRTEFKMPVKWTAGVDRMPAGSLYPAIATSFTNDDWAGWEVTMVHQFSSILERGRDYSYDSVTGTLTKLQDNDVFEQGADYEIHFAPHISDLDGDGGSGDGFSDKLYITANYALSARDYGKDIAIKGTGSYIEITLPKLSDVVALKKFFARMPPSNTVRCAKFKVQGSDIIDFGRGNKTSIRLLPTESFEFYKEIDDLDPANIVSRWVVRNAQGNFLTVGETISDESDATHVINKVEKDGGGISGLDADVYGRLYEDHVLDLPASQVVPYSQWANGMNRYKYSLKDAITNKFRIPDTTGMFERQSSASRQANSFEYSALEDHEHLMPIGSLSENGVAPFGKSDIIQNGGQYYGRGSHKWDLTSKPYVLASPGGWVQQDSNDDTRPDNVANNKWLRI